MATCTPSYGGTPGLVSYQPVPPDMAAFLNIEEPKAAPGAWYWKLCGAQPAQPVVSFDTGAVWLPTPARGARVDPATLAEAALQRSPLPDLAIAMSPGPDIAQVVNLPTYLWVDPAQWVARVAAASVAGITSTVTAVPERIRWDMGQGDTVTCDGPGRPWSPEIADNSDGDTCSYTYRVPTSGADGRFTITATVDWRVTWRAAGAPGGGDLGVVSRSSATSVRVLELRSVNVSPRP